MAAMFNSENLPKVIARQSRAQKQIRRIPPEGQEVEYMGRSWLVLPSVFIPLDDSRPLIENIEIDSTDEVLDVFCGSGVISVSAALRDAKKVVALDINPNAIECTRQNAEKFGVGARVDARVSDVYSALDPIETFDVVTANAPFLDHPAEDLVTKSYWDPGLSANNTFFEGLDCRLRPGGRAYISQANYGDLERIAELAAASGFRLLPLASIKFELDHLVEFLAFELRRI